MAGLDVVGAIVPFSMLLLPPFDIFVLRLVAS